MIGKTAKSEQFMSRSANHSTKGSAKGFSLLGEGDNPLSVMTLEERRDSLVKKWQSLQELRKTITDKAEKKRITAEITDIQNEFTSIRKKRRAEIAKDIPSIFLDVCRERLTKPMFKIIMDEASERQREIIRKEGDKS